MTCHAVMEQVEAIAAGDLDPGPDLVAHIETCPRCAAALADARRIETLLATRPAPAAPPQFVMAVQQRIRRERWQTEEQVDRIFNVAIGSAAALIVLAVVLLLRGGLVFDGAAMLTAFIARSGASAVDAAAPALGTYVAATGLLVSGLVMWWWAES